LERRDAAIADLHAEKAGGVLRDLSDECGGVLVAKVGEVGVGGSDVSEVVDWGAMAAGGSLWARHACVGTIAGQPVLQWRRAMGLIFLKNLTVLG